MSTPLQPPSLPPSPTLAKSQEEPGGTRRSQEELGGARRLQGARTPRGFKEPPWDPKDPWSPLELLGTPTSSYGPVGASGLEARISQEKLARALQHL